MSTIIIDTPTTQNLVAIPTTTPEHGNVNREQLLSRNIISEIKNEPPEDISDSQSSETVEKNNSVLSIVSESPKIRLTPTIKLLATPNPVDPKRKFVCPYDNCTKSYGKSSHLRSHLTWHTGIKPFVCQEPNCGKGFTRSDELNRHVRTHTGEKPFECVQCTKKFSRSDHLTKHLATHAKQMQNSSARRLRPPQEEKPMVAKPFIERKISAQQMDFNDGMHFMAALVENATHSIHKPIEEPENLTDEPPIEHEPIKIKLERPDNSEDYHIVQPPIKIEDSPVTLVSTREYLSPPDIKSEPCDDAIMPEANAPIAPIGAAYGMAFENYTAEVAFDPERPFRCSECIKCFKRQDDLNRHMRTHSGEKPFSCSECDRRFMRRDHLKKHLKTHTRIR